VRCREPLLRGAKRRRDDDLEQLILGVTVSDRVDILIRHGEGTQANLLHQRRQFRGRAAARDRLAQLVRRRPGSLQKSRGRQPVGPLSAAATNARIRRR